MSKAKLKKYLQTLSKEQVIEVMLELYDARKEAKEYLEFYLTPDSNAELVQVTSPKICLSDGHPSPLG